MKTLTTLAAESIDRVAGGTDAVQLALEAVRGHLGMAVAYVSEFDGNDSVFRAVDAPGHAHVIKPGDSRSLDDVFCRHILAGRLPELMPDVSREPLAMSMPIMAEVPIGAHISVPIRKADGEVYGMFCCLSFEPNPSLNARDLQTMRVFAEMAAHQINAELVEKSKRQQKVSRIRSVIENEAFRTVFQPIFDFHYSQPIGFECLCRFTGEPYRSPDKWFAEAVSVDLGVELEWATLALALRTASVLPDGLYVSLNASPELILTGRLPALLRAYRRHRVVLEVTEHAAVSDYAALRLAVRDIRDVGVQIGVDDAGAGYSSLQHIVQLSPDIIKLDLGLTRGVDADPARRALISALIYFARETGSMIIAEGIETEAERQTLQTLGVSKGQGYLLGRPAEIAAAAAYFTCKQDAVA